MKNTAAGCFFFFLKRLNDWKFEPYVVEYNLNVRWHHWSSLKPKNAAHEYRHAMTVVEYRAKENENK